MHTRVQACMPTYHSTCAEVIGELVESVVIFYHAGPRAQTHDVGMGRKRLCILSLLTAPCQMQCERSETSFPAASGMAKWNATLAGLREERRDRCLISVMSPGR